MGANIASVGRNTRKRLAVVVQPLKRQQPRTNQSALRHMLHLVQCATPFDFAQDGLIAPYNTFNSNFVANTSSSTANSLRNNPTFMRCAAIAPSGAVRTVASATHSKAGR